MSEDTGLPEGETHQNRNAAESFGSDPERYDRVRPRYPAAMVESVVAALPGVDVLDVGCGTGITARQFQAAGCTVLGVDVDARMAEVARRCGAEVEVAAFETWNTGSRKFDAVVSGQAWHWVDPVVGAAKAAQILRPGGRIAVFWNVLKPPPAITEAFTAVYRRVLPDMPMYLSGLMPGPAGYLTLCDKAADGIRRTGAFDAPEQRELDWNQTYYRDEWLDQLPTFAGHSQFPAGKLDELLAGIGGVIDSLGGRFTMRYTVAMVTATRIGP
ncbi:class I SAM-dependent methyltransferase [Streptomyces sp. NBC_01283]|uniref:class I SAM-dependent methyltransferase n=1 Tax=Streptomyces sp. NBC_01283 TaxID=2903812 RepID=UPI00352C2619|nr:class I SAM-dependent methyltransferase [Streptomyces sp. NBC_01283]